MRDRKITMQTLRVLHDRNIPNKYLRDAGLVLEDYINGYLVQYVHNNEYHDGSRNELDFYIEEHYPRLEGESFLIYIPQFANLDDNENN